MRIIAGKLGGRHIDAPKGHRTHPMSEKARGGLFNSLGELNNLRILDAFAGSGAIGLEAVSRGAREVLMVEKDRTAQDTIDHNIRELRAAQLTRLVKANVGSWSDNNVLQVFDIVIADPPHDAINITTLHKLLRHLTRGGLFVLCWPAAQELPEFSDFLEIKRSNYGDATLAFYRKIA